MPKIIFEKTEKHLIPEHLQSQATEVDGKFELDASGVLSKNKELLTKNAEASRKLEEANAAKEAAEVEAAEWKGKAKIPNGKKVVDADVAELGEAAKEAGVAKDELPTLKTENESLKAEKARAGRNEARGRAAAAAGLSGEKFAKLAESEDFDIESETVKENGKDIEKFFAVTKNEKGEKVKTAFPEFVEKHPVYSLVLDSLKATEDDKRKTTPFPKKEEGATGNDFDAVRKEVEERSKQRAETAGSGFAGAFGIKK